MGHPREMLESYFQASAARDRQLRRRKPTDQRARVIVKHIVPMGFRGTARMILTDLTRSRERRKAAVIARQPSIRLHLGSGGEPKAGWVNIDLVGDPVDVAWNLASPLPFQSASVDAVFHEHLLEHLPLRDGAALMQECYRILKPGGILRVGVPDAGKLIRSYAGDREYLKKRYPDWPTAMVAVQELFYRHRHCAMFDNETLRLFFTASGFSEPKEREYGDSNISPAPDTERRRDETLYMEACKPQ